MLVLTPTTLNRNRPQHVLNYFHHIADASPLLVFLHTAPKRTLGVPVPRHVVTLRDAAYLERLFLRVQRKRHSA